MQATKLTHREREILELLAFGSAQKEIASHLDISVNTVDVHLKNIKGKTGLQKATELATLYFTKRYHMPVIDIPEHVRRTIATALLVLSLFTAMLNTTDMLRTMRVGRSVKTTRTARSRGRRNKETDYEFMPFDTEFDELKLTA